MKIGLIGEDPNDTKAIQAILENYCEEKHEYCVLLRRVRGSMWDSPKYIRELTIEYEDKMPDLTIIMRDLDGLEDDRKMKKERNAFMKKANDAINHTGIKLLHIWEIEALAFADVDNLNAHYNISVPKPVDPMTIKEPKELLMNHTAQCAKPYNEGHISEVCEQLNPNTLIENCRYFAHFIRELRNKNVK